jgi:hypothetical protein
VVDHDFDVMLIFLVEGGGVLDQHHFAVDADAGVARLLPFGQFLAIFALAAAHHGGEQVEAGAFGQGRDAVHHLRHGLRADGEAGRGAVGDADARPQEAHIVVDFRDRGDGGARVAAGGLLLDRDGGAEALDMLDIGLLHHLQKLARIGGERLHIAALTFRIDGVEGEGGFAGTGQAGDDDQAVTGQIDIHTLEIMFTRAAYGNMGQTHGACSIFVPVDNPERNLGWEELESNVPSSCCR